MKGLLIAVALIGLTAASVSRDSQWEEFKLKFKKGYRSLEQESERKAIFMEKLDVIENHNVKYASGESTYMQGVNQFSDMTFEEFQNSVLMREVQDSFVEMEKVTKKTQEYSPDSQDWTYAMGAVGTVEAQWTMAGNSPVVLSEQMLVDCGMGDCNGGWADRAYDTIISEGGDCLESDYPYQASNGMY